MSTITRGPRVELFRGEGTFQPWYLRGVAANGEKLWVSEGYFSRWNAKRAWRKQYSTWPLVDLSKKPYNRYGAAK